MHICHAGLIDIAVPITYNGETVGYTIMEQVRTSKDFSALTHKLSGLRLDFDLMKNYYNELPMFDYDKIQSILVIAEFFSKYIVSENIFHFETNDIAEKACSYIKNNFSKNIGIEDIVKNVGTSKSVLYRHFNRRYGCTPGEYINRIRTDKAAEMLIYTDYGIETISERTGFSDVSYFSKIFKKTKGISPLKYRKAKGQL